MISSCRTVGNLLWVSFIMYPNVHAYDLSEGLQMARREEYQSTNTSVVQASTIDQSRYICPIGCNVAGPSSINWAAYHDVSRLGFCNQTMLLDFTVHNPLGDKQTRNTIRCCTAVEDVVPASGANATLDLMKSRIAKRDSSSCVPNTQTTQIQVPLRILWDEPGEPAVVDDLVVASDSLSQHIMSQADSCKETISFSYLNTTVVGFFGGSATQAQGLASNIVQTFVSSLQSSGYSGSALVELCSSEMSSRYTMGMVVNAKSDVLWAQKMVATWASGACVTTSNNASTLQMIDLTVPILRQTSYAASSGSPSPSLRSTRLSAQQSATLSRDFSSPSMWIRSASTTGKPSSYNIQSSADSTSSEQTSELRGRTSRNWSLSFTTSTVSTGNATFSQTVRKRIAPRDNCRTVQVAAGDSCASLANECGITGDQFTQYNPQSNLCSSLTPGQHVCCSPGSLPNYSPSPNANGTCATYYIQTGDTCSNLAASNGLTVDQLNQFNNQTWGWMGCNDLQAAETMCLSSGSSPMPAVIPNANCGPQVPGTPIAPAGTDLSTLNQCPLRACCDIWGQCGTTSDFCTQSDSPTGAPGTAAQGQNGCISNCGTDIIVGGAPSSFWKVGYFEAFNLKRPCLNQPISSVDLSGYTHVHLSFAVIAPNSWTLDVSSIQSQFDQFVGSTGYNKILAVGGWAFSTDPGTINIFREAMAPANRDTLATNIVAFLEDYELDGIDIDYEYPGEPDIAPYGTKDDCDNYLAFLESLRAKMPNGKTISITAPASFWYLRFFRLAEMAFLVDYFVYMTYDLHGQWDYSNKWSDPGCPGGNCLRSHVNFTETLNSLSMITKAGIPSSMVVVGVSSYGRSFQMTTPGCTTEQCTYTGAASGAFSGECTGTPGYIANAEIAAILAGNATVYGGDGSPISISSASTSYDSSSNSDVLVYNDDQWVAYMSDNTKANRREWYQALHFLGTADWAIDLQSFEGDAGSGAIASTVTIDPIIWATSSPQVSCAPPCVFVLPPYPLGYTSTVSWPLLTTTLLSSSNNALYTVTTTISVPQFTMTAVSLQPVTLGPTDTATYKINPVQSITPSSFIFTLPPNEATFPPTQIPTSGASLGGPGAGNRDPNPTSSSTTVAAAAFPGVTFYSTPFPITIQPQPTYSVTISQPPIPAVTISTGPPGSKSGPPGSNSGPQCKGTGCGSTNCGLFGCGGGCGLFACNGGCSIFGCGGGCGILGCGGGCALSSCGGAGCSVPGTCGGSQGGGESGSDPNNECSSKVTASACTYVVSSYSTAPMTTYATTTKTSCLTSTVCNGADTQTTETAGACMASISSYFASELSANGVVYSGTLMPVDWAPDPAATTGGGPDVSYFGFSASSSSTSCTMCYWIDGTEAMCSQINGCTATMTATSTSTSVSSTTTAVVVPTTVHAICESWIVSGEWKFQISEIQGWAQDQYGKALLDNERGYCTSDVENWTFDYGTPHFGATSTFNLPYAISAGCVERAIVAAGGPQITCHENGEVFKRDQPSGNTTSSSSSISSATSSNSTIQSVGPYPSMIWDNNPTVTVTIYNASYYYSTYVETTVITNGTMVPIPMSVSATTTAISNSTTGSVSGSAPTPFTPTMTSSTTSSSTSPTSAPTQSGIVSNCNEYYTVQSGDSCTSIESQFSISFSQFYAWNPAINSDCSALWIGDAYCVGVSGGGSSGGASTTGAPAPTQSGIASDCTQYYTAQSGDSCSSIESQFSISFQQFYSWNPAIGSDCSALWVGEAYCVSAPGNQASSSGPPAPTQSGIASNCAQYYVAQSGDSCSGIESQFNISFDQFYAWNPAIGSDCSALWVGEAYCVAVSS